MNISVEVFVSDVMFGWDKVKGIIDNGRVIF